MFHINSAAGDVELRPVPVEADGKEFFFLASPLRAELGDDGVGWIGSRRGFFGEAIPDDDSNYAWIAADVSANGVGRSLRADGEDVADFGVEII